MDVASPGRPIPRPAINNSANVVNNTAINNTNINSNSVNSSISNSNGAVNIVNIGGYPGGNVNYPPVGPTISVSPGRNWGPEYPYWQNQWYNNHVHSRYRDWYHGAWNGNSYSRTYAPFSYGVTNGWGLSSAAYESGYVEYTNPYMTSGVVIPGWSYDRPVAVVNYATFSNPEEQNQNYDDGLDSVDRARQAFRNKQYRTALKLAERGLAERVNDPVAHEFYALCLFAEAEFEKAALVLNSLLASAPGWDWTTIVSLYGSTSAYEAQLRRLERFIKNRPQDAAARFVLAYHYLVCGRAPAAIEQLEKVVQLQPNDQVAAKMLASFQDPEASKGQPARKAKENDSLQQSHPTIPQPNAVATIDWVGRWQADRKDETFTLEIGADGKFVWTRDGKAKDDVIRGTVTSVNGLLVLESPQGTTMVGRVTTISPTQFHFALLGGAADDRGLLFKRG